MAAASTPMLDPIEGPSPSLTPRTRAERYALIYTPIWTCAVAIVVVSGAFRSLGNLGLLGLGVGLSLPLFALPLFVERAKPLPRRYALRWVTLLALFSLIQNYFGATFFFDVFGMQYHFHTTWILHGTPVFLYFMTVAYFATYYAIMQVTWRALGRGLWSRALLSYAMAFAETAFMANRQLEGYFSYRDPRFVMVFGSVAYGTIFFVTLPLFERLGDEKTAPRPLGREVWDLLALNLVCLMIYEVYGQTLFRWISPS